MKPVHRSHRSATVRLLGVVSVALATFACGVAEEEPAPPVSVPVTIGGVGSLPDPLTGEASAAGVDEAEAVETVPPIVLTESFVPFGERARGNRLIVIGDSITASTSRRYGNEMCFALVPLGWAVEVNAEVSRFVDFGHRVLDRRLRPAEGADWDAAVVFLGTNYGGDAERYRAELEGIVDRLDPRPTVLVTVTEFRPDRAQVNTVIREMALARPNVEVLEWAETSRGDRSLLAPDGIHLSADGRARLVVDLSELLGPAPPIGGVAIVDGVDPDEDVVVAEGVEAVEPERPSGECLPTSFTDDSGGRRPGAAPPPATLVEGGAPVTTAPATTSGPATTRPAPSGTTTPATSPTSPTSPTSAPPATSGTTSTTAPDSTSSSSSTSSTSSTTTEPAPTDPPATTESPTNTTATTTATSAPPPTTTATTAAPTTAATTTAAPPTSGDT